MKFKTNAMYGAADARRDLTVSDSDGDFVTFSVYDEGKPQVVIEINNSGQGVGMSRKKAIKFANAILNELDPVSEFLMSLQKFYILDGHSMQAVPVDSDTWEDGVEFDYYNDALIKAEELAVASPLETFTIVRGFARVAVPKQRPPKVTTF